MKQFAKIMLEKLKSSEILCKSRTCPVGPAKII